MIGAALALALSPHQASAADPGEEAADAAEQLEEAVDGPRLAVSGIINRALLIWDDGDEIGIRSVDNPQDSSGIALEATFGSEEGWNAGFTIALDTMYASADTVDQLDWNGDGLIIELPYLFGQFGHERFGTVIIGHSDSASDEIENINLSESDAVADASVNDWIDAFYLRATGISGDAGLATGRDDAFNEGNGELRWGDFIDGKLAGESGRFVTYITPEFGGFEASAAIGRPQEVFLVNQETDIHFTDREGGVYWDAAVRYSQNLGDSFRVEGGVGYWRDTTEEDDATEPTEDEGWGGSLAVRHEPTGLNLAVSYAAEDHTEDCEEPGEVSQDCRGQDQVVYVKGGIVRDLFEWGSTSFYGEYHRGRKDHNDSDEDLLRTLELNADEAEELESSKVAVWGLGVVQEIESLRPIFTTTHLYLGYRHYDLDVDLVDADGPVSARGIEDIDVVMAGVTIQWGGAPERECPPVCEREEEVSPLANTANEAGAAGEDGASEEDGADE
jgi:hypothetical protein